MHRARLDVPRFLKFCRKMSKYYRWGGKLLLFSGWRSGNLEEANCSRSFISLPGLVHYICVQYVHKFGRAYLNKSEQGEELHRTGSFGMGIVKGLEFTGNDILRGYSPLLSEQI